MTRTFAQPEAAPNQNSDDFVRYPYRTPLWNSTLEFWELGKWLARGRPPVLPDLLKRRVVAKYAAEFHLDTFVESGTYLGATVEHLSRYCSAIYSVEFQDHLWRAAYERFANRSGIRILHGSGASLMSKILAEIHQPALFWLDGHFAAGTSLGQEVACPTLGELAEILKHPYDHVVLVDDVREFRGKLGYPALDELMCTIQVLRPDAEVQMLNDIMRITPRCPPSRNVPDTGEDR